MYTFYSLLSFYNGDVGLPGCADNPVDVEQSEILSDVQRKLEKKLLGILSVFSSVRHKNFRSRSSEYMKL